MRWLSVVVLAIVAGACSDPAPDTDSGLSSTAAITTTLVPVTSSTVVAATAVVPEGFTSSRATVLDDDGTACELCVWLADTPQERSRGLMFATDFGAADAMAFRYPAAHTGTFWMKNTLMPLSIAFYTPSGEFLDAFDMEPCTSDPCPSYPTAPDFGIAVEVPQGELESFGMVPGSTLEILELPCDD